MAATEIIDRIGGLDQMTDNGKVEGSDQYLKMRAYCDILAGWVSEVSYRNEDEVLDIKTILSFGARTKTVGLLSHALKTNDRRIPKELSTHLAPQLPKIEANNYKNLADTVAVCKCLEETQVDYIVFKGPIQSSKVYGVWNARAALDIDILVRAEQYETAKQTLIDNNYELLIDDSSKWWQRHLGEAPFQRQSPKSVIIDLHNQVQQPGGPYPRNLHSFFEDAVGRPFGRYTVQAMSPTKALMISAIGYGKSFRAGTPWLHHAHEIIVTYTSATDEERIDFSESAKKYGLLNLYKEALEHAQILFGVKEESYQQQQREDLIKLAFGHETHHRFFRTVKLWDWTDGNLFKKLPSFLYGLWRVARSEFARLAEYGKL